MTLNVYYKINGELQKRAVEGFNLRHSDPIAKDEIDFIKSELSIPAKTAVMVVVK